MSILTRLTLPLSLFAALADTKTSAQTDPPDVAAQALTLPPIDCPLQRAGVDPSKLKPFEEVEKYIAFLERPGRAQWQRPDAVIEALGLKGTETVADLGAGSGYFAFQLAKAVPRGQIIAIDSEAEMVRHVHRKAQTEGVKNLRAQLAQPEDPALPDGTDLVFVCDVLMHVKEKSAWLRALHAQMRPGARITLIDFKEGDLPEGPPESVKVPKAEILRLCTSAGFRLEEDRPSLLPYQEFLVFSRP